MIFLVVVMAVCVLVLMFILGDLYARDHERVDRDDWPDR